MRIIFAGTPEIAVPSLEILAKNFEVCGVLTNPDRPKGRKKKLIPSPVKEKALELGLTVYQPEKLTKAFREEIEALKPDLLVSVAYGKIFREKFLGAFPRGGLNLHPSLLPLYRGASPLMAAILGGDDESGITVQRLAPEMDSGNILVQRSFPMNHTETTLSLTKAVSVTGAEYLLEAVTMIDQGKDEDFAQDHDKATYCTLVQKEDGLINWEEKAELILRKIRAYNPWPLAHTSFEEKGLNILQASLWTGECSVTGKPGSVLEMNKKEGILIQTGEGIIAVTELQLQSKKVLDHKSFINGVKNFIGAELG